MKNEFPEKIVENYFTCSFNKWGEIFEKNQHCFLFLSTALFIGDFFYHWEEFSTMKLP
jgi:hypothetical protein